MESAPELVISALAYDDLLPDELVEQIVSNFDSQSDKTELSSCSLLSRQWHRVTVPHLFAYLEFTCVRGRKTFEGLASFLRDHRDAASSVRTMCLTGKHDDKAMLELSVTVLHVPSLAEILSTLPRLDTLQLDHLRIHCPADYVVKPSFCLRELRWGVHCSSSPVNKGAYPHDLAVVKLFSSIRVYRISASTRPLEFPFDGPDSNGSFIQHLALERAAGAADTHLTFLLHMNAVKSLTNISIKLSVWPGLNSFAQLLSQVGSTLRSLKLDMVELLSWEAARRPRIRDALREGLAACQALHTLELIADVNEWHEWDVWDGDEDAPDSEAIWLIHTDLISFVPSESLNHLVLKLRLRNEPVSSFPWTRSTINWEALRIACLPFNNLSSITLGCESLAHRRDTSSWNRARMEHVLAEMQLFHQEGVLFFDTEPDRPVCSLSGCWYQRKD